MSQWFLGAFALIILLVVLWVGLWLIFRKANPHMIDAIDEWTEDDG
jgi:hypothetical protein